MKEFVTDREALDYLSARIASEADRENTPLSEVERKMLYFSETDWTLPDMAVVNAEFDRNYDEGEYERKIAGLVRKIEHGGKRDPEQQETWDAAVEKLSGGDRYLLVMLDPAFSPSRQPGRPPHDILKLWLTAFNIVFGLIAFAALGNWLFGARFRVVTDWFFQDRGHFWLVVIFVVLVWYLSSKLRNLRSVFSNRR